MADPGLPPRTLDLRSSPRRLAGFVLIALGLACNEWLLAALLSPDGVLEATSRALIRAFDLGAVAAGLILARKKAVAAGASLALLVATTGLSVATAEVLLRVGGWQPWVGGEVDVTVEPQGPFYAPHPTLGHTNRPGEFTVTLGETYSFRVTHGSDSLRVTHARRDAEPAGRPEIWVFGCSFTYGWSVNDWETYPWLLQAALPEYEVVNFGVSAYGTLHALIQFRAALGAGRRPAIALLTYASFHDHRNTFSRSRRKALVAWHNLGAWRQPWARFDGNRLTHGLAEVEYRPFPLARHSALVNFIDDAYNFYENRSLADHEVSRLLIGEFSDRAEEEGIAFVLAGISGDSASAEMLEHFRHEGLAVIDVAVDLSRPENNNEPYDGHPSALAHRRYARRLEELLRRTAPGGGERSSPARSEDPHPGP